MLQQSELQGAVEKHDKSDCEQGRRRPHVTDAHRPLEPERKLPIRFLPADPIAHEEEHRRNEAKRVLDKLCFQRLRTAHYHEEKDYGRGEIDDADPRQALSGPHVALGIRPLGQSSHGAMPLGSCRWSMRNRSTLSRNPFSPGAVSMTCIFL